ncbi:hypothetical protein [Dyadobacter alkalitolerans]|uniref:hypothetical protein n=1 Tax=Dyadobacter alkalitolerans TaxID=492736 RepID=UPI0004072D39|nr:hypothetical protein [Dyadobacter alkalitolerans]
METKLTSRLEEDEDITEAELQRITNNSEKERLKWYNNLSNPAVIHQKWLLRDLDEVFDKIDSASICRTLCDFVGAYTEDLEVREPRKAQSDIMIATELMAFVTKINRRWETMRHLTKNANNPENEKI